MSPIGNHTAVMNDKYFIAEVWGWPPSEVREMFISERKEYIRRKVEARQQRELENLERMTAKNRAEQAPPPPAPAPAQTPAPAEAAKATKNAPLPVKHQGRVASRGKQPAKSQGIVKPGSSKDPRGRRP